MCKDSKIKGELPVFWLFICNNIAIVGAYLVEPISSQYVFTQHLHYGLDVTLSQFFNQVQLVWIQSFPSPRLII